MALNGGKEGGMSTSVRLRVAVKRGKKKTGKDGRQKQDEVEEKM